jgi:hypothetical protein
LIIKKKINKKIKVLNVTAENWINMNKIFLYFSKNIQNKIHKLVINRPYKKHLDYYSSSSLLKKNFKTFQFTNFRKSLYETFRFKN